MLFMAGVAFGRQESHISSLALAKKGQGTDFLFEFFDKGWSTAINSSKKKVLGPRLERIEIFHIDSEYQFFFLLICQFFLHSRTCKGA